MRPRSAIVLTVIAAIVLAAGWWFGPRETGRERTPVAAARLAFPDLTAKLAGARRIELVHQGKTIELDRTPQGWSVKEQSGYPALPARAHALLAGLAELRLVEPRTSDPAEFGRLGLDEPSQPTADSTLIRIAGDDGAPIAALIVGHSRMRGQGLVDQVFVRRPGENQAWLAEGRLELDPDPKLWLDRDIVNIDHDRIKRVTADRGGQHLELARTGGKLALTAPAEHPPLDEAKLAEVGRALEQLSFMDVKPAAELPGTRLGASRFELKDGVTIAVEVNKADAEIWVHLAASGEGAGKEEAARLQARFGAWAYGLGGWKEKALTPTLDDLKAPPPPAPPAAAGGAEAAPAGSEPPAGTAGEPVGKPPGGPAPDAAPGAGPAR